MKLIASFLSNRTFQVKIQQFFSTIRNISAGVPQGSPISSILYIYTSDIPIPPRTHLSIYADDTTIITSAEQINALKNQLMTHLEEMADRMDLWKIKINIAKTQLIYISRKHQIPPQSTYL